MRNERTLQLATKYKNAFILLTIIAHRARRNDNSINEHNLELGEALIGDYATCGMSEQEYRTAKLQLTRFKIITTRATTKGTIAKLTDTSIYDINIDEANEQDNGQVTDDSTGSQRTPNERPTTNKEVKKVKKKKKERIYPENSNEFRLAKLLFNLILERKPDYKKPDLQSWAIHIDRMINLDNRNPDGIEKVIRWSQKDKVDGNPKWNGWQNIILSTAALREKFDQIELQMNQQNGGRKSLEEQVKQFQAKGLL